MQTLTHTHTHPANTSTLHWQQREKRQELREMTWEKTKKLLLSVFCKKRLQLDSCQGAATEWFHKTVSDCVRSNYFMFVGRRINMLKGQHCSVMCMCVWRKVHSYDCLSLKIKTHHQSHFGNKTWEQKNRRARTRWTGEERVVGKLGPSHSSLRHIKTLQSLLTLCHSVSVRAATGSTNLSIPVKHEKNKPGIEATGCRLSQTCQVKHRVNPEPWSSAGYSEKMVLPLHRLAASRPTHIVLIGI